MFDKKDIKNPNELTLKFILGQTVRVKTKERKISPFEPDPKSFFGQIGEVNSIAEFGDPISRYEIGVVFKGDMEDTPPTIFDQEDLETLGPKFVLKQGGFHHENE